ncbi:MAG: hypothetical protein AAB857_04170 [Patescibacteria group bacterium]
MNPERNIQEITPGHRIEISSEMVAGLRTHIDESYDLVIYKNPGDELNEFPGKEVRIVIQNPKSGEYVLDFADFAKPSDPDNHLSFETSESFLAVPPEHLVLISPENLKNPREILILLHELGHIRVFEKKKLINPLHPAWLSRVEKGSPAHVYAELTLQDERDAWAEAICLARKIKKDHAINLFSSFEDLDDFMGWFRLDGLRSYEELVEETRQADDGLEQGTYTTRKKAYTKDKQVEAAKLKEQILRDRLTMEEGMRKELEEQQLFE